MNAQWGNLPCPYRRSIFSQQMLVGIPCGFEAVADLETARRRLIELASANPGEYFIFDLHRDQIVVSLVSAIEELDET
jgi:hypothetical protein